MKPDNLFFKSIKRTSTVGNSKNICLVIHQNFSMAFPTKKDDMVHAPRVNLKKIIPTEAQGERDRKVVGSNPANPM